MATREERKAHLIEMVTKKMLENLTDEDFEEGNRISVRGTVARIIKGPPSEIKSEELQILMAQGELEEFCWSHNTISWPPENVIARIVINPIESEDGEVIKSSSNKRLGVVSHVLKKDTKKE
ncbi:hypothetical protein [Halodesulfovibrio aestuarii]|uniref:hypothetical protein n=1 Tax=Halodesulfovibrio aestuarii TaxID=126333 RepID=UPI003D34A2BB